MTIEQRVHAVGHYTLVLIAVAWTAVAMYLMIQNALHPTPLLEACPVRVK